MDDDLDYSNDMLLRQLQAHKQEIEVRLAACRDGLQLTVDQISHIEQKREVEKSKIEKEFEKTKLQMLYLLDQRKKQLLKELDVEIDTKRQSLLNRVQTYQHIIIQAADLQPEIMRLEKYELNNNDHIITSGSPTPTATDAGNKKPFVHLNKFINEKLQIPKKKSKEISPPRNKPPPPPSANHNDDFMAVPSPSLHNLPLSPTSNGEHNKNYQTTTNQHNNHSTADDADAKNAYTPTTLQKKRLMLELERFLIDKPPIAHKPSVAVVVDRSRFILDLENRFGRFCHIASSTGSSMQDFQASLNHSVNWVVTKTNPIVSLGSMIANGFKKKQEIKELKTIPAPLLIIPHGVDKVLAEQFAECLSCVTNESGVIITVIAHDEEASIKKWLDPRSINATKIATTVKHGASQENEEKVAYHNRALNEYDVGKKKRGKLVKLKTKQTESMHLSMHENDYAYNPTMDDDLDDLSSQRSVLRVCIVLYEGEKHSYETINRLVESYSHKYNLKNICGVEMKKVSQKPSSSDSFTDVPHCYVGNIFYDHQDGVVEGQESIFDSIAKCVWSPNTEFDDDEINAAIDKYDAKST